MVDALRRWCHDMFKNKHPPLVIFFIFLHRSTESLVADVG